MNAQIEKLFSLAGRFSGKGINHEGQLFTGTFEVKSISAKGLSFSFSAAGEDGTLFHSESSLIGFNMKGALSLWVLSTNHPGVFERTLVKTFPEAAEYVFAFGNKDDRQSFREEIKIALNDRSLAYTYFWGLPDGDFAERSGCKMVLES